MRWVEEKNFKYKQFLDIGVCARVLACYKCMAVVLFAVSEMYAHQQKLSYANNRMDRGAQCKRRQWNHFQEIRSYLSDGWSDILHFASLILFYVVHKLQAIESNYPILSQHTHTQCMRNDLPHDRQNDTTPKPIWYQDAQWCVANQMTNWQIVDWNTKNGAKC